MKRDLLSGLIFTLVVVINLGISAQAVTQQNPVFLSGNRVIVGADTLAIDGQQGQTRELLLSQRSQQADLLFGTAMQKYAAGNFKEAVYWLDSTLSIHPQYAKAYTNRGYIKAFKNALLPAFRDFNLALEIDSTLANAWFGRARAQDRAGKKDEALRDYGKTLQFDPNYQQAYYFRSVLWQEKGQTEKALADLNNLLATDSAFFPARNDRALLLAQKGFPQQALSDFDWLLKQDSSLVYARFNRACLRQAENEPQKALADLEVLLAQKPDFAAGWQLKGNVLFALMEYEKAKQSFNKAIELGENGEIYVSRAACLLKLQAYKEAIDDCNKLLANGIESGLAYLNRGIGRQMLNDSKGACEDWAKAQQLGIADAQRYLQEDCTGQ